MRPVPGTIQPSLYGDKLVHLLMDAQEKHAMLPVKPPQRPVLLGAAPKHLATCKAYVPPVPMQEDRSWWQRRQDVRKKAF